MDSIHFKTDFSMKKKCFFLPSLPSVTYYLQSENEELQSAWSGENGINLFKMLFSIQPLTIERNFCLHQVVVSLLNQTKVRFGINSDTITCAHKLHCVGFGYLESYSLSF